VTIFLGRVLISFVGPSSKPKASADPAGFASSPVVDIARFGPQGWQSSRQIVHSLRNCCAAPSPS
jgi:hypothetical protein